MTAPYRRAPGVALVTWPWPDGTERVYLARVPDGPIVELNAPASMIVRSALREDVVDIAADVAHAVGLDPEDIRADVDRLLIELEERGLLEAAAARAVAPSADETPPPP